jgi:UDP-2-acetamido-3-amino-2,3-dideoxy-glucuronate N-acetyltransferase
MSAFVDPTATLGEGTRVWHFAVILQHAVVGDNCSVGAHAEIGRGSTIGDRTRISSKVFLPPNSVIGDDVFVGPGCIFTDDRHPKAGNKNYKAEPPFVGNGASLGAGVVVLPGVKIGENCLIGAGSVVTRDVPANTVLRGEPSRLSYVR